MIASLHSEIQALGPSRPGRRFPPALRRQVQAAIRGPLASWGDREVAQQLGIAHETVRRWRRDTLGRGHPLALVPVEVEARPAVGSSLRLVTPGGYVVEGLDLDATVALLARLG